MYTTENSDLNNLKIIESLKGFNPVLQDDRIMLFSTLAEEYNALYYGAGLRINPNLSLIELTGSDVLDFLHRITTNSTKSLTKGNLTETIFVSEKGRVLDKTLLLNLIDKQILICSNVQRHKLLLWIDKYTINDDVKIHTELSPKIIFELYGQQAESFLAWACKDFNALEPNSFTVTSINDITLILAKTMFNNRPRVNIIVDLHRAEEMINYFIADKGIYDFSLIGEQAFSAFKIEQGIVEAPNEINDSYNPFELGFTDFVDTKKGCYIGQEVLARLITLDKVQKKLFAVNFPQITSKVEKLPSPVYDENGEIVGLLTSMAFSPKFKKNIGLGIIKKDISKISKYHCKDLNGQDFAISFTELPFRK